MCDFSVIWGGGGGGVGHESSSKLPPIVIRLFYCIKQVYSVCWLQWPHVSNLAWLYSKAKWERTSYMYCTILPFLIWWNWRLELINVFLHSSVSWQPVNLQTGDERRNNRQPDLFPSKMDCFNSGKLSLFSDNQTGACSEKRKCDKGLTLMGSKYRIQTHQYWWSERFKKSIVTVEGWLLMRSLLNLLPFRVDRDEMNGIPIKAITRYW